MTVINQPLPEWLWECHRAVVANKASDLFLTVGAPPCLRINREVHRLDGENLTQERLLEAVRALFPGHSLDDVTDLDGAIGISGLARFRVHAFLQRGSWAVVSRVVPTDPPLPDELDLPQSVIDLTERRQGLVLITGATGSGKSTTLAALIRHMNETTRRHIVTIEQPVEYLHRHKLSIVQQREVGKDVPSFQAGLYAALREAADVIMVGELRDLESMRTALQAAETGHLVFGTMHTANSIETIDRMIEVFPAPERPLIQNLLASTLLGVVSQMLVPAVTGGMVAVFEVLLGTSAVKAMIRRGNTAQIISALQAGGRDGMQTLEVSLFQRMRSGLITKETAMNAAYRPDELASLDRPAMAFRG